MQLYNKVQKVYFLIDGFNLYHSICDLEKETSNKYKWLDLFELSKSYIHAIATQFNTKIELEKIFYFSAFLPKEEINKEKRERHQIYVRALETYNIQVELSKFKTRKIQCKNCHKQFKKYEEKETDVHIASKVFELLYQDHNAILVLVTGDTDLIPAIKIAKNLYKDSKFVSIFPYNRKNEELITKTNANFSIKEKQYKKFQLPREIKNEVKDKIKIIAKPNQY